MLRILIIVGFLMMTSTGDSFNSTENNTGCQVVDNALEYLDGHPLDCASGSVLTSFGMATSTSTQCSSGRETNYVCTVAPVSSTETRYTACNLTIGCGIDCLDRQDVSCNSGEVLSAWELQTGSCTDTNQQVQYECSAVDVASTYTVNGDCQQSRGENLIFLDRHVVTCAENEAISAVRLDQGVCSGDDMRFE